MVSGHVCKSNWLQPKKPSLFPFYPIYMCIVSYVISTEFTYAHVHLGDARKPVQSNLYVCN